MIATRISFALAFVFVGAMAGMTTQSTPTEPELRRHKSADHKPTNGVSISVDGKPVFFQGPGPRRVLGRFLVPLRGIFEHMGAHVKWDDDSQSIFADRNDTKVELTIGSNLATVNGRGTLMDVPAQLIDGSTFVPLRFLSESLGARVNWDPKSGNIDIDSGYPHKGHEDDPVRSVGGG